MKPAYIRIDIEPPREIIHKYYLLTDEEFHDLEMHMITSAGKAMEDWIKWNEQKYEEG